MSEPMTAVPLLVAGGLTKRYGGVVAVDEVSLELFGGEVLGLVGPNGAGKTTLVDLIDGAQQADHGELRVSDRRVTGPPARRAKAGLARTFQHPQLAMDLTVRENLLLGVYARRLGRLTGMVAAAVTGVVHPTTPAGDRRVAEVAAELRIGDVDRRCADLSLGEQRLVEVARAMVQDPKVLLLDEPFAGSDADGVAGIAHGIKRLVAAGCGVLLVDHNVDIVAGLVDRIVLLSQGQVAFDGGPSECLASPEMQRVYFGTADEGDKRETTPA